MRDYSDALQAALEAVTNDSDAHAVGKRSFAEKLDDRDFITEVMEEAVKDAVPGLTARQRIHAVNIFWEVADSQSDEHEQPPVPTVSRPRASAPLPPPASPTTEAVVAPVTPATPEEPAPKLAADDAGVAKSNEPAKQPESLKDRGKRWWTNAKTNLN